MQESVAWAQAVPPTAARGHEMLEELQARLQPAERQYREEALMQAHGFIDVAARARGLPAPAWKSFPRKRRTDRRRIDIEVRLGVAFVPGP